MSLRHTLAEAERRLLRAAQSASVTHWTQVNVADLQCVPLRQSLSEEQLAPEVQVKAALHVFPLEQSLLTVQSTQVPNDAHFCPPLQSALVVQFCVGSLFVPPPTQLPAWQYWLSGQSIAVAQEVPVLAVHSPASHVCPLGQSNDVLQLPAVREVCWLETGRAAPPQALIATADKLATMNARFFTCAPNRERAPTTRQSCAS